MKNRPHQRWQEHYIKRALLSLPREYILKKLDEYKKPISKQMKNLIQWRLYQPETVVWR